MYENHCSTQQCQIDHSKGARAILLFVNATMAADAKFLQQLSLLENDLLSLDRSSFQSFHARWSTLVDDLETAIKTKSLQDSTITTAYTLANRVTHVVQMFLDLEILAEKLMGSLLDDTSSALDTAPTPSYPIDTSAPPYLKLSYDWLVENIHNPYPSSEIRDAIARTSGAARKDVDNWFVDARKRIGWNNARKAHFFNKRVDIVNAATRFYANDEKLSLNQGAEHALVSIMKNAKDLYSDKFGETLLASRLAAIVKDLTPETKAEANAERMRQVQLKKDRASYPSPDRSPGPSHPLPIPCEPCDDEVDAITIQSSRKRRNLSVEPIELNQSEESSPAKRTRSEATPSSPKGLILPTGLPSPAPSMDEPLQANDSADQLSPPPHTPASTSRKRRLSDSDGQYILKRPRHLSATPRPQTVSDPTPLFNNLLFDETSFDGWFQQVFDRPEADTISPSGFSVELGNFSDFDCDSPATELCSTSPEFSKQIFKPPTIEVADNSTVLDMPWNGFDLGWTGNLSLSSSSLEQSTSLANFVGQAKPLVQDLVNFQESSRISRPVNEFESFFDLSNPSTVDPVVIPSNPVSDDIWNFSNSTVNRDDANVVRKHNADFLSNDLLASFDFSQGEDFLPSRSNAISLPAFPQGKARQEKEKEFRETYEKAHRLALELQRDDLLAL
ncbi:Mating-type protein beta1-1 [Termitomyces sp. T112]|nr:Mating-type protein beta1-1 [Termitomyces sp. T112]